MTEPNPLSALAGIIEGREMTPPRMVIYGVPKIGKSTLASTAPNPIFLPTEKGLNRINCKKFPLSENYDQFRSRLESLIMEEHTYETLAVDSGDWLERLIHAKVCQDSNVNSIELAAGGYGKGYAAALNYWNEVLEMLDAANVQRGMTIIVIAHCQIEKFEDPDGPAYDRYSPKLHKKTACPLVTEWADAVLFATRKVRVSVEKNGFNKTRATAAPIGRSGGDRILRCVGGPTALAGNRFNLPDEIPLEWNALASGIAANWEEEPTTKQA